MFNKLRKIKKTIIWPVLLMMLITGCGPKKGTAIYFEPYNQLENPIGENDSGDEFTFEVEGKRYEVMAGWVAEYLGISEKKDNSFYTLIMADCDRKEIFSTMTEQKYCIAAVQECTDIDGTVYIFYAKENTGLGTLYIDELISSHILEIDMNTLQIKKRYDFGASVVILTVYDGYVYTMEDGRIYRQFLDGTGSKECMADLGFRGIPDYKEIIDLIFQTEENGICVTAYIRSKESEYGWEEVTLSYVKYTDSPIESE